MRAGDVLTAVNGVRVVGHGGAADIMFTDQASCQVTYIKAKTADREIIRRRKPTDREEGASQAAPSPHIG